MKAWQGAQREGILIFHANWIHRLCPATSFCLGLWATSCTLFHPGGIMSSQGVTQDTELDLKDVELSDLDTEKQPMNASPPLAGSPGSLSEKNGVVKVKVAEEEDEGDMAAKFTGLSKEELLQVAGTPGWVRTRWALLILFWLGWLGMLAGAIVIIVQAPRCKELPRQQWWQKGGIYRIQPTESFQDSNGDGDGDLAGERPEAGGGVGELVTKPQGSHSSWVFCLGSPPGSTLNWQRDIRLLLT